MSLGTNIYRLRTHRGFSQGGLAEALQVSRQSVSKWETDGATPDLDKLLALSDLFGVTLDALVRGEISEASPPNICEQTPAAEIPVTEQATFREGSVLRIILVVIASIWGLGLLFSVFMSPSLWPGLMLLVVMGGLFWAWRTRVRAEPKEPGEQQSPKKRIFKIMLIAGILLLPVLAFVITSIKPPVYAQTSGSSPLIPRKDSPIQCTDFSEGNGSVSYTLKNTSAERMTVCISTRRLEIKQDGKWHLLEQLIDPVYVENIVLLSAGESRRFHFYFHQIYGKLSPGEYRVVSQVYPTGASEPSETYWIATEFQH